MNFRSELTARTSNPASVRIGVRTASVSSLSSIRTSRFRSVMAHALFPIQRLHVDQAVLQCHASTTVMSSTAKQRSECRLRFCQCIFGLDKNFTLYCFSTSSSWTSVIHDTKLLKHDEFMNSR